MNKATKEELFELLTRVITEDGKRFLDLSKEANRKGFDTMFESMKTVYSKPPRAYHTLDHISWVLKRVDEMAFEDSTRGSKFSQDEWDAIRLAAWFHDYVLVGSPDDEAESAKLLLAVAMTMNLKTDIAMNAARLIMATNHERVPLKYDEAILCDCDLAILGADEESFDHYEALVRKEWEHVPEHLFRTARTVILKRFVDRPWIYMTEYGRTRWERRARANLQRSLERLRDETQSIPTLK